MWDFQHGAWYFGMVRLCNNVIAQSMMCLLQRWWSSVFNAFRTCLVTQQVHHSSARLTLTGRSTLKEHLSEGEIIIFFYLELYWLSSVRSLKWKCLPQFQEVTSVIITYFNMLIGPLNLFDAIYLVDSTPNLWF